MSHPLALPKTFSPDALDTTAELAAIVARLRPPQSTTAASGAATGATPQPGTNAAGANGASANESATIGGAAATTGPPINLRDLPTATDSLKHKLRHARDQIKTLPDVNRTVTAQENEIRQLEARIDAQRAMLARLRADGARFAEAGEQNDKMEL